MKKISLLITLAFLAFSASLFGQKSDNVTLKININPIQTIVVNPAQKSVDLNYLTKENYTDGVTSTQENHLTIYSTSGFQVTVKSDKNVLENGSQSINASDIKINVLPGSENPLKNFNKNKNIALGISGEVLFSKPSGTTDKNVNVSYTAAGKNTYLNKYIKGENPTVYEANITYTIEPI